MITWIILIGFGVSFFLGLSLGIQWAEYKWKSLADVDGGFKRDNFLYKVTATLIGDNNEL